MSYYATFAVDWLDLAKLMISSAFTLASLDGRGLPHHTPWAVVEQAAREKNDGVWRFDDVQHAAILLGQSTPGGGTLP